MENSTFGATAAKRFNSNSWHNCPKRERKSSVQLILWHAFIRNVSHIKSTEESEYWLIVLLDTTFWGNSCKSFNSNSWLNFPRKKTKFLFNSYLWHAFLLFVLHIKCTEESAYRLNVLPELRTRLLGEQLQKVFTSILGWLISERRQSFYSIYFTLGISSLCLHEMKSNNTREYWLNVQLWGTK